MKKKFTEMYDVEYYVDEVTKKRKAVSRYTGVYYRFDLPPKRVTQLKVAAVLATVFMLAMYLLAGLAGNAGGYVFYVVMPFSATVFPVGFLIASVGRLVMNRERFTVIDKSKSVDRMKTCGLLAAIFGGIAAISSLTLLIQGKTGGLIKEELLFLIPMLLCAVMGIGFFIAAKRLPVVEAGSNENPDKWTR